MAVPRCAAPLCGLGLIAGEQGRKAGRDLALDDEDREGTLLLSSRVDNRKTTDNRSICEDPLTNGMSEVVAGQLIADFVGEGPYHSVVTPSVG